MTNGDDSHDLPDAYLAGQVEQTWARLVAMGDEVRAEEQLPQARCIANEMMRRVKANLELVVGRLRASGYRFARPKFAIVPPDDNVSEQLAQLESMAGPLPLALRAAYEVVGVCNLTGTHPAWARSGDAVLRRAASEADVWLADPLVIEPLYVVLEDAVEWDRSTPFHVMVAGDARSKAEFAEGLYTVELPGRGADAPLLGWRDDRSFVDHLRTSFRFGGFAGFELIGDRPEDLIEALGADLLPF